MGLSITDITDKEGAALYVLFDGREVERRKWQSFADEINRNTGAQTVVLSVKERDGERVRDFYDLDPAGLPHVLIIRDNDEIVQSWHGHHSPNVSEVAYALRQVGV